MTKNDRVNDRPLSYREGLASFRRLDFENGALWMAGEDRVPSGAAHFVHSEHEQVFDDVTRALAVTRKRLRLVKR